MKEQEAVAVAKAYAEAQGYNLDLYEVNVQKQGAQWDVNFRRKSNGHKPRPGDFFTVLVNDSACRLIPGK